jgi:hypothetical protein
MAAAIGAAAPRVAMLRAMKQYWARHQGKSRWGVRTPLETSDALYKSAGMFFVWADKVELQEGNLVFLTEQGEIRGAIAAGRWDAVFEAGADDDAPQAVETKR